MNPRGKKFISLFLVFSLVTINCASLRTTGGKKEKHGAKLIITKKNGYQTEGELIAVKPNSLLLLSITGRDVSVEIEEIKIIRIEKKSKMLLGVGLGAAICIVGGGLLGIVLPGEPPVGDSGLEFGLMMGACFSPIAAIVGGTIGGIVGIDKTIYFEGMSDSEVSEALDKLRKKARIRDYK